MIDQRIFEDLQTKIDDEIQVREVRTSPRSARAVKTARAKPTATWNAEPLRETEGHG